jgi:CRP-like cAMP-binding protein
MADRPSGQWQAPAAANLLLRSLNRNDARLLAPLLTKVHCRADDLLEIGSGACSMVYFPETLVASLHGPRGEDADSRMGVGLVGCEGMVGWSALFDPAGIGRGFHSARVACRGGTGQAIAAAQLRAAAGISPTLTLGLMRFVETFIIQMSRTILSSLTYALEARVSSWVLMLHDRIEGDELAITHEALAGLLAVRRASITDALHLLEGERALRCNRGRMVVRDRARLETLAGSAYGAPEHAYRASIGPFGKSRLQNDTHCSGKA